ncbi:carboxypeptidase-like regulatory domain-containing protein [Rhodocytophaga aerolata]|uniref:Carboxypeptidase-like regulatory domain-containing protein n=1 Tax=Rhodocytophaga aerolata TaxID=455078 RepID=A0ABT8R749_9BACT|nr:carboxypeptidase-like regulatory domain-containing protein [Rhodocytophaga aerolata]MDO1447935.1 carboxypeptidase-like regulatory domain-containing protein [Rhodocytophaga aerolata]
MITKLLLYYSFFLWLFLSTHNARALSYQQSQPVAADTLKTGSVKGRITQADNGEPIPFANVFLNNSTVGTTSDEQGYYTLPGVPLGNSELIVSYVGFTPYKRALRTESISTLELNISLSPVEQVLGEVRVQAKQDKTWQRLYRRFERNILGETVNAPLCKILNPWVLEFNETESTLTATATQPLEIENRALGYKLIYYLKQFELSKTGALYLGETKFEELKAENTREEQRWKKNRRDAYMGSIRHFFKSLIDNTWEAEGFLAYKVERDPIENVQSMHRFLSQETGNTLSKLIPAKVLFPGPFNFEKRMVFPGKIEIIYIKANDRNSPYKDAPFQVSRIRIRKAFIELNSMGQAYDPSSYELTGYLVKEGVADMLPFDYLPAGSLAAQDANAVAATSFLDSLQARLVRWNTLQAEQKIYLHLDKNFYVSGEMLWYSAYLVDASSHGLYPESQVAYIDLISPEGKQINQQKIKVIDGRAAGNLALPTLLPTGVYRLRAYTNWMQNAAPDYFFDKPIEIYHIHQKQPIATQNLAQTTSKALAVQFFPEGGNLVRNIASRVGFKALGPNGKGLAIKGTVMDEEGNKIVSFESNALGMGSFYFKPLPGKKYQAVCESTAGSLITALPEIQAEGITLTASLPDSGKVEVKILSSSKYRQETITLVGQTRGRIYYTHDEKLTNGVAFIEIPIAKFPDGICQLTLFTSEGKPLCERLLFVHDNGTEVSVNLQANQEKYEPREPAEIELTFSDASGNPVAATVSLSVTDAQQIPPDSTQEHILSYLLLTSDLKGYIESPSYYFQGNQVGRPEDLDNLLLTQGWRRFTWQPIIAGQRAPVSYANEKGLVISGQALTTSRKKVLPLSNTKLTFIPIDTLYSMPQETTTRADGRFVLPTYDFMNTATVMYEAKDAKSRKTEATLQLDTMLIPKIMPPKFPVKNLDVTSYALTYIKSARTRSQIDSAYAMFDTKMLEEVVVKGKKVTPTPSESAGVHRLHSQADDVLIIDEKFPTASNIYELFSGRLAGVQVTRDAENPNAYNVKIRNASSFNSSTQPLYLMDGMPIQDLEGTALMSFNPMDVSRIEILKGASASMYGVRGGNGVIAIYTKKGKFSAQMPTTEGMKKIQVTGFNYPREFYSPDYEVEKEENVKPDHRATLYWEPLLYTDENGKANISFSNSDVTSTMEIRIEGISATGHPILKTVILGK